MEVYANALLYEEHNVIKMGDVIRLKGNTHEAIVTRANEINIYYLFRDGSCGRFHAEKDFEKIGHFDSIDEFMRSEE
jgi:predicted cupin superfamily sugar epimerase